VRPKTENEETTGQFLGRLETGRSLPSNKQLSFAASHTTWPVYGKEQTAVLYRLQASERWSDEASTDRSYVHNKNSGIRTARQHSRCCGQFWHEDTQLTIYCVRNYEYAFTVLRSTAYGWSMGADGSLASVVYSTQYSASPVSVLTPLTSPISLHT
ncbi:hypothetical protein CABS01_04877, partial [Colletotrichum abscissum]|uniref:uncharacterized protein n=1 Tax=Colletotrichum abscissum TaxID=1671311 RepID=UPI0027D53F39